jgi:hypothetical protein
MDTVFGNVAITLAWVEILLHSVSDRVGISAWVIAMFTGLTIHLELIAYNTCAGKSCAE